VDEDYEEATKVDRNVLDQRENCDFSWPQQKKSLDIHIHWVTKRVCGGRYVAKGLYKESFNNIIGQMKVMLFKKKTG